MRISNNKNGFLSIVAAVVTVAVVGGGILMGTAVIDNVAKSGCGDSVERWRDGQAYADIADNKEGAIEDAQKCQEAVVQATEVAKANAALLGRASNISGSGAELIATEAVNIAMDYVEESAKPNYKPLQKNNKPPKDVVEQIKEEEKEREAEKSTPDQKQPDSQTTTGETKQENVKEDDCHISILPDGSPNVLASCERSNMGFWYSDKDGDIVKTRARFRINIPQFGGQQELAWEEVAYTPGGNPVCGFEPSNHGEHPDTFLGGYDAQLYVDIQLIDSTGKTSSISSCQIQ